MSRIGGFGKKPIEEIIEFRPMGTSASGKTKVWYVINTLGVDDIPGIIKWHGPWRKYVYITGTSFYDSDCLKLIGDFLAAETKLHYERLRDVRAS